DRLRLILERHPVPATTLPAWLEHLEEYLEYECRRTTEPPPTFAEYCEQVRRWRDELLPKDFAQRLRAGLGKDYWHHSMREDVWKAGSEVEPLADEILANPGLLESNIEFLCSSEARSAGMLGLLLGRKDAGETFFGPILCTSQKFRTSALLRGY